MKQVKDGGLLLSLCVNYFTSSPKHSTHLTAVRRVSEHVKKYGDVYERYCDSITHAHVLARARARAHTHTHTHTHILHTHTHTLHTHTYKHKHTHTHTPPLHPPTLTHTHTHTNKTIDRHPLRLNVSPPPPPPPPTRCTHPSPIMFEQQSVHLCPRFSFVQPRTAQRRQTSTWFKSIDVSPCGLRLCPTPD